MLAITSPRAYAHEAGLRIRAGQFIKPYATHIRIFTSPQAWQAVNPELSQSLEENGIRWQLDYLEGECTEQAIASLKHHRTAGRRTAAGDWGRTRAGCG